MWTHLFFVLVSCVAAFAVKSRVCYYRNKAYFAESLKARFLPEYIDANLCTVINYAYLKINLETHLLETTRNNDLEMIARINALKNKHPALKTVIAVGGWKHEKQPRFTNMVQTTETRKVFIESVIAFLTENNLDGVSYDWMYPAVRPKMSPNDDAHKFILLLKETLIAFRKDAAYRCVERFTLTASVSASRYKIKKGYEISQIAKYVDRVDIMGHSLWGHWKKTTGSPTAMDGDNPTVVDAVRTWLKGGMPANKTNLIIVSYGRSFKLASPSRYGLGVPVNGSGEAGIHTKDPGILAYYEICSSIWSSKTLWNDSRTLTPFASHGDVWVGYDNVESIKYKIKTVVNKYKLNGITFWSLDMDDFDGTMCHMGKYPLLNAAVTALTSFIQGCETKPCKNGGKCISSHGELKCKCEIGYTGNFCTNKEYCIPTPCKNGGTCVNTANDFKCTCTKRYTGKLCNECANDHGICKLFDDAAFYCKHIWMALNCRNYCGICKA